MLPTGEVRAVADIEIGFGKSGRRAYGLDEITIVPARRTRDPDEVDISWEIDAYRLALPLLASAMDSVTSPETAGLVGKLGGIGVLNVEGLWTRYEDPAPALEERARRRGCGPHAGGLRGATHPGADRRAGPPDPGARRARQRRRDPAAGPEAARPSGRRRG